MNYAVSEFKPISESPRRLQDLDESRGQLLRVHEAEGFCIAIFAWGAVSLPEELRDELELLVGKTAAVLRLDGRYNVREV